MADIQIKAQWYFVVDSDEAALILASLGSRLRPEDVDRARELGDRLTEVRMKVSRDLAEQMAKHVKNMKIAEADRLRQSRGD